MREAIVYHSVDPMRLTEDYFKIHHKQQGCSRVLMNDKGIGRISLISGAPPLNSPFTRWAETKRPIPKQRSYLSLSRNARD
jgi:hypothetical protein